MCVMSGFIAQAMNVSILRSVLLGSDAAKSQSFGTFMIEVPGKCRERWRDMKAYVSSAINMSVSKYVL